MPVKFKHDGPRVLLVEGKNDCHLISSLCRHYDVPQSFGLHDCGSDEYALKTLSALIAGAEPKEAIGIVLDADNPNLQGKWHAVRDRLMARGYEISEEPHPDGTMAKAEGQPTVGVWLMPDNKVDGMLEDFCRQLATPAAIEFAEQCVKQANESGHSTHKDAHLAKATIHTYLAWQDEPGMPMGQAVSAKALDANQPIAQRFHQFLRALFCAA